jgi:hypothetical protein
VILGTREDAAAPIVVCSSMEGALVVWTFQRLGSMEGRSERDTARVADRRREAGISGTFHAALRDGSGWQNRAPFGGVDAYTKGLISSRDWCSIASRWTRRHKNHKRPKPYMS